MSPFRKFVYYFQYSSSSYSVLFPEYTQHVCRMFPSEVEIDFSNKLSLKLTAHIPCKLNIEEQSLHLN